MKQCPKCNFTCADEDVICKNCGYLFTPSGFEGNEPSQGGQGNNYSAPPQGNFNNPNGVPPQNNFVNPNGVPPQNDFSNPNSAPQNDFNNQYGNAQQGNYDPWQDKNYAPQYTNYQGPKTNGFSIASLVLGICGIVFSCCYAIGLIPSVISLIFGIISSKKIKNSQGTQQGSGMSIAGIILSCFGLLLSICFLVLYIYIFMNPAKYHQWMQQYMQYYQNNYGYTSSY